MMPQSILCHRPMRDDSPSAPPPAGRLQSHTETSSIIPHYLLHTISTCTGGVAVITIAAHGVQQEIDDEFSPAKLSPMQRRLLKDTAPIRICGAPTGSGKTYAFLQGVHKKHYWVLFVVPTQALAANIAQTAKEQQIDAVIWDSAQHNQLIQKGRNVWEERTQNVYRVNQNGGLIITTPETLGQIFLGVPYRHKHPEMDLSLLLTAAHIVFDEVHLLTEQALGFVQAWMTLIAGQDLHGYPKSRLTLLSATHSDLPTRLVDTHIPESLVSQFDEEIITPTKKTENTAIRFLHGTVTIHIKSETLPSLLHHHLGDLISQHQRLLVIFDSLKQYSQHATRIEQDGVQAGLTPDQIFVVTGQERQAKYALDAVHFDVGIHPTPKHRLIIGTSALEVGITYPQVTAALIDPGLTPAALIQRIGRVARGNATGEIFIAKPHHNTTPGHLLKLESLENQVLTADQFRQTFVPYVPIHWRRACALGSAYWSMMHHTHAPADQALRTLHKDLNDKPLPGGQMNQLRREMHQLGPNGRRIYQRWLDAVDDALQDVRGFLPTVSLQFAQGNSFTYARDWAMRYLRNPDHIDVDNNQWIYRETRDQCLLEKPRTINVRLLLPTQDRSMNVTLHPEPQAYQKALEQYAEQIRQAPEYDFHPIWEHTCRFIEATGLLIRDRPTSKKIVDMPPIDGSYIL